MKKYILAIALSALTLPVYADTTINGKVSTLGLGVEAAFPVTQSVDARIGVNGFHYTFNKATTSNGQSTTYNGNLDMQSLQALADWHPWQSSFRVTGGLVYNNNQFKGTAQPTGGKLYLGGSCYGVSPCIITVGDAHVDATVDFDKIAPYLGIGWGRAAKKSGLSFTSDVGVLYAGTPKTNLTTVDFNATAADLASANAALKDSLNGYKFYPIVSIGIGYSF